VLRSRLTSGSFTAKPRLIRQRWIKRKRKAPCVRRRELSTLGWPRDTSGHGDPNTSIFHMQPCSVDPARSQPMSCWIITDGKVGMDVQVRGVADALGVDYEMKRVSPHGIFAALAPWGPVTPLERFGSAGSQFAKPWPQLALATGRASIPYIRALKRRAGRATYTVVLQDPRTGPKTADLIWVPAHDLRRGPNVVTTLTAPHSFSPARLAELRSCSPADVAALPRPRVAVILGGNNGVYTFTPADEARLSASLASLAGQGASFMITPSRRTHAGLSAAVTTATHGRPRLQWDGTGDNPYPGYLANADVLIVTADSVNMCGEACATGRPVYVFTPSGGSAKFRRFHEGLTAAEATRPLPERFDGVEVWRYTALDSAGIIAAEIRKRWHP